MLVAREYTQPIKLDNFSTNQAIALAIDTIFSWPIPLIEVQQPFRVH